MPPAGRRRLIRARDLAGFRQALVDLALDGEPLAPVRRAILLPTQGAIALFRRTLESAAARAGRTAFVVPELLTREGWLIRAHAAIADAPALLTAFEREAIMERAARTAGARARMLRAPFDLRPGMVAEILAFYDELRRRHRTVRRFARVLFHDLNVERGTDRGSESLIHQTAFLAFAFLGYERAVRASGRIDEHALRQLIIDRGAAFPFANVVVAIGDHPADPRGLWPADFDVLGRLGASIDLDVVVTDDTHDAGFRLRIEEELPGIDEQHAETASTGGPLLIKPPASEGVVFVHRDREEELRDVARQIRRQAADTGCELREPTAIVFQRPLPYLYLADSALAGAGLPYYSVDAMPLAGDAYAALLDLTLDVARTGGTRESIVAILRATLCDAASEAEPFELEDAAALERVLSDRRSTGEAGTYPSEVDAYFGTRETRNGLTAARARRAAEAAARIGRALAGFRSTDHASAQVRTVLSFLHRHGNSWTHPDADLRARHLRARAAVLAVLDGLAGALERHDDHPRTADALTALIRHWIERHTFAPQRETTGIALVDGAAARFGEFDHVHLIGLVETEWPDRPPRTIFYTSGLLKSLGWPQEQDDARAQQAAFRDLLRLPRRTLRLHAFQLEGDGLVAVSPIAELARDVPGADAPLEPPRAVFADELLTSTPPNPARLTAHAAEWLRLRSIRPPLDDPRYAGSVGPQAARAYRVSRVDHYVDCPFKYFAENVLELPEEREEWSGLSPLERGTLVHTLFEQFYRAWQARGGGTITSGTLPEALELFGRVAEEALARMAPADRALEEMRLLGSIVGRGLAERVFEIEAEAGGDVADRLLEFEIKGAFQFPRLGGMDTRAVEISGKADRIDIFRDGSLRVVDYKLSRVPDVETSVQIAVYAHAVQQALEQRDGRRHPVTQAMYLAFGDERQGDGRIANPGAETGAAVEARASEFAVAIEQIEAGRFPPQPRRPAECQWCRYAGVCRKEYVAVREDGDE